MREGAGVPDVGSREQQLERRDTYFRARVLAPRLGGKSTVQGVKNAGDVAGTPRQQRVRLRADREKIAGELAEGGRAVRWTVGAPCVGPHQAQATAGHLAAGRVREIGGVEVSGLGTAAAGGRDHASSVRARHDVRPAVVSVSIWKTPSLGYRLSGRRDWESG